MKFGKKIIAVVAGATLLLPLAACGSSRGSAAGSSGSQNPKDITIGIDLPDQALERWAKDGAHLKQKFESQGFKVNLQYANSSTQTQASQIQNMANQGAKYILVTPQDGTALGPAVAQAKTAGATVIAYDRIVLNTKDVAYYATYDNEKVGQLQGKYIVQKLGLDQGQKGPFNIELMSGDPSDNNAKYFFAGAWKELQPYFESGALVSLSGKVTKDFQAADYQKIGITNWDTKKAQDEMGNRINSFYAPGKKPLDAVLSPNDALALGTVNALKAAGYDPSKTVITGQDADTANVQLIVKGQQSMTVFKNSTKEADAAASIIEALVKGKKPTTSSVTPNGSYDVPTIQLAPTVVTKDNVKSILVDSGYITAAKAGL